MVPTKTANQGQEAEVVEPLLVPVWPDAAKAIGLGRTKTFELIASGALPSVRVGKRRLVPASALRAFVDCLVADQLPKAS
jgi:excisionase family DNA binding protein